MKIVQINTTCGSGSTGKICVAVSELINEKNIENYILYSSEKSDYKFGTKYMSSIEIKINALFSRILGNYGFNSKRATKRLISEIDKIKPDIVHLHNLHGHNCDLEMLFNYLKKEKIKIFWTFHDCWAFTGYCPHFDMIGCNKWRSGCGNCLQKRNYSWIFDKSDKLFSKKEKLLSSLDLTIITPSKWLASLVKESFLKSYPVRVINNGIDLSVFKPTEGNFKKKYCFEDKKIVLGVAFGWGERKGLDVFIELSKRLDKKYQIVLVGTNDKIDKQLPNNIISIHRTQNQKELAEIYTAADVFVNPTREENFPTTHLEALACGTPVVAFNTGGCAETIDETCGCVVEKNDISALKSEIIRFLEERPFSKESCIKRVEKFNQNDKFMEYVKLYFENADSIN